MFVFIGGLIISFQLLVRSHAKGLDKSLTLLTPVKKFKDITHHIVASVQDKFA